MSWQSNWGTTKSTNAKACALYFEVANVGKTIESSKKRVIWRVKVQDGREFEIILTHSLASGKKILRVDGIVKYTSKSLSFGDWDYVFNLPGGYAVHIIIKPSTELNDMYDLIIDGTSFRRLPDRLDPNKVKNSSGVVSSTPMRNSQNTSQRNTIGGVGGRGGGSGHNSRTNSYTYEYSSGGYAGASGPSSRESSFGPWPCSRCTLVNEKGLAPVCEACGAPKPDYISPEDRQRAKEAVEYRPSTSATRAPSTTSSPPVTTTLPNDGFSPFATDPFAATASAFEKQQRATTNKSKQQSTDDISSMLSGLDFTAPPPVAMPATASSLTQAHSTPTSDGCENAQTASDGDLWGSKMVDLNLKPAHAQPKPVSAKHYQTLEQARLQAPPKDKVLVLQPPPAPLVPVVAAPGGGGFYNTNAAAMGVAVAPGGFYQQQHQQQPMHNTVGTGAGFSMAPTGNSFAPSGAVGHYNTNFAPGATPQQIQQQQQFRSSSQGPAHTNAFGADPFATLS